VNDAGHYHGEPIQNDEREFGAAKELDLLPVLDFRQHVVKQYYQDWQCNAVFVDAIDGPMELASCQNVDTEKETGNRKNTIGTENASLVEIIRSFSVLLVNGFERSYVLLALKKLLEVMISIQIQSLINELCNSRVLIQHTVYEWIEHGVLSEVEARRLQIDTVFKKSGLKNHATHKIIVCPNQKCLVHCIELVCHLL